MAMTDEEQKQKHREAMQKYYRKTRGANLEQSRLKSRAYYAKNREAVRARAKKRRDNRTPEQRARDVAYMKVYYENHRFKETNKSRSGDGQPTVLKSYSAFWGKLKTSADK